MKKQMYLGRAGVVALVLAGIAGASEAAPQAEMKAPTPGGAPEAAAIRAIAEEGFIYGLPIVMNYAVMYEYWIDKDSGQYKAPMNTIFNEARVFTPADTAVITPNSDTPYSFGCFDLRAQPWVLSVPAVEKQRYYSVQFTDWNTFNVGYVGSRATGNDAGDYLLVGPDWKGETPKGIKGVIHSTTQFCLAIYRTQLFNADDMPNVKKVQAGYKAQPLNEFLKQPAPPAAPAINFPKINKEMAKTQLLVANPLNRYLINSPMLPAMKKNADGSLTLYVQKSSPGAEKESNWLPAPDGPIYLVMRLYWPKEKAPSILPPGEGSWKPPAVAVTR
ncbi:MAG: DUF1254 domain-containing protein [Phycisphaerales bacterium]